MTPSIWTNLSFLFIIIYSDFRSHALRVTDTTKGLSSNRQANKKKTKNKSDKSVCTCWRACRRSRWVRRRQGAGTACSSRPCSTWFSWGSSGRTACTETPGSPDHPLLWLPWWRSQRLNTTAVEKAATALRSRASPSLKRAFYKFMLIHYII